MEIQSKNDIAINDLVQHDFDQLVNNYGKHFTTHEMQSAILQCSINNISRYIARKSISSTISINECLNECSLMIKKESIKISKKIIMEED